MERQEVEVKKIQRLLSDAESIWKDLARQSDLFRYTNNTIETVNKATETILINNEMGEFTLDFICCTILWTSYSEKVWK